MKKIIVIMLCLCAGNAAAFGWGGGSASVAGKANIANPTFTGTVAGPAFSLNGATFANTLNVGATTTGVTDLLVNPAVKASGNLLDLQVGGASKLSVSSSGVVSISGSGYLSGNINTSLINGAAGSLGSIAIATQSNTSTSGTIIPIKIIPTYNQASGTATNTDFLINRTETAVGSGTQRLISAGTGGGSYTEQFGVSNKGMVNYGAVLFAALGTPANGTFAYCSDCTTSTPATCTTALLSSCTCAGSGTGALAKRLNGSWYCN